MYRACSRCGKIHEVGNCSIPRVKYKGKGVARTDIQKFRSSGAWKRKAEQIRHRDNYLCRLCLYEHRITTTGLQVHHIVKIKQAPDKKLEDDNLITLCSVCHERCENDVLIRVLLSKLAVSPPVSSL